LFRRQVYATFEEEPLGPELLPLLGPDNFMWASDYPHPDSTFPHSREAIAHAFRGLDRAFVEQVTATNCARLYGFAQKKSLILSTAMMNWWVLRFLVRSRP